MSTTPTNDRDRIVSELVREDPSFADIVLRFVAGLGDRLRQMEQALRTNDFETLRIAAHQLKGSGGGHGYPALSDSASRLEKHALQQATDECLDAFAELKDVCSRVAVHDQP